MNKVLIACIFFIVGTFQVFSQGEELSNYSFVVVPKRFDFQFEEDQYQLNSLLKFLFNKHGFHAYFENELPDVRRCDGLWAEVNGKPGFIWNEVSISLKDCNGVVMFKTTPGKSKIKEYGKAYTESLRSTFLYIEVLGVRQKEVNTLISKSLTDEDTLAPNNATVETVAVVLEDPLNLPTEKYCNFSLDAKNYLLRKTSKDYRLYEETPDADEDLTYMGKLFVVEGVLFFETQDEQRSLASFDDQGNLRIKKENTQVVYQRSN